MVRASALSCPSCGASITLHAEGWAVTVACVTCGSVLDALDPNLRILQRHAERITFTPKIPLGTRGTIGGVPYEAIGCQRVTITVEGVDYSWSEYVCFNPYHGFMYLSEYEGHWNVIEKLRRPPQQPSSIGRSLVKLNDRTFHHFQSATARTTFALGEFPWELRVGDTVNARDFTSPPFLSSAEGTDLETTWSLGTYTEPAEIARMFGLPSLDRSRTGVFANQPNPHVRGARLIRRVAVALLGAWLLMLVGGGLLAGNESVFNGDFTYDRTLGETNALVTEPFELKGRSANVQLEFQTDLKNDWVNFALALINNETGQSRDFGTQASFYSGTDSDGSWSEGARTSGVTLASVPAGRYLLRIAPEGGETVGNPVRYSVRVKRDVPSYLLYFVALAALVAPMLIAWFPAIGFENRRWMESDHEGAMMSFPPDEAHT